LLSAARDSVSSLCAAARREQPHILDSDRRLICEGLQELDLWIREQPRLSASDRNRSDGKAIAQYWDSYDTAIVADQPHWAEDTFGIGEKSNSTKGWNEL
jgi:hypothetical protein